MIAIVSLRVPAEGADIEGQKPCVLWRVLGASPIVTFKFFTSYIFKWRQKVIEKANREKQEYFAQI